MTAPNVPEWVTPGALGLVLLALFLVPIGSMLLMMAGFKISARLGRKGTYTMLPAPAPIGQRRNPKEGHCIQFVGRLGSGKTSLAVRRAVSLARRYNLPLYANAPVRDDATVLRNWRDLDELPTCVDLGVECVNGCHKIEGSTGCHPAVVLLDELHLWYPSTTSLMPKEQQQEAFRLLSFARKRGWTVLATTQAPTRVHTGWRQLMTEQYRVLPISPGYLHKAAMIDVQDDRDVLMPIAAVFTPARAQYNTRAEVAPLWAEPAARNERRPATGEPSALPGPPPFLGDPPLPALQQPT